MYKKPLCIIIIKELAIHIECCMVVLFDFLSLTDDRLFVMAGNIVPLKTISVEVVKDGKAVLTTTFTVVRLRCPFASSVWPVSVGKCTSGPFEAAWRFWTSSPKVIKAFSRNDSVNKAIFSACFNRDRSPVAWEAIAVAHSLTMGIFTVAVMAPREMILWTAICIINLAPGVWCSWLAADSSTKRAARSSSEWARWSLEAPEASSSLKTASKALPWYRGHTQQH